MPWSILWSIAAHHGEPADPDLLEWIKARIDHILDVGPWVVVAGLGLLILLLPLSVMAVYLLQQRRQPDADPPAQEHEEN
jgi:hypothetical protein